MKFQNVDEALRALENFPVSPKVRQAAIHYLAGLDECFKAQSLVRALHSDDPGVRWEAGNQLAIMGETALSVLLKSLRDPKQVGDLRFRESALHVIHRLSNPDLKNELEPLTRAITGVAADIETMREANRLLRVIDPTACDEEEP